MYKLIDGREKGFEVVGEAAILEYLGYDPSMKMDEASDKLEEENCGMDFYHIVEA